MGLFQNSVLNKYLASQDHSQIHVAYGAYLTYFHNPIIRENIRNSKEEQFQEGFLRELFVKILGYTINPEPDYNLTTELKNIKDSRKTDGAILKDGKALTLQSEITRLDREIDQLVYELYELTEEEIRIVEGGEG